MSDGNWERGVIEKLVADVLAEQRRARRWGILFKGLTFAYLIFILVVGMGWVGGADKVMTGKHTALVDLQGVIAQDKPANAEAIKAGLQQAFSDKNTQGVVLRINSPGGSPVQAGQINDEIRRLRAKHKEIPLYVVIEDVCASGGYYVAAAADKIFVDKASIVGSIGVLMDGFGFQGTMEKLGVERRLLTAGENKGFLDPFSPLGDRQKGYAQDMLNGIHQQFIRVVREGRGKRLKETQETFSGLIWTGEESIKMGLADGLGDVDYVAREVVKAENVVDYTPQEGLAERVAKRFGATLADAVASNLNLSARLPR